MHTVRTAAVEQADKAVQGIADRTAQIFAAPGPGEWGQEDSSAPDPFAASPRPRFLTEISQAVKAAQEDVEHLARKGRPGPPARAGAEPDLILALFERNLVEEAEDPEKFRQVIREFLCDGGTVEVLISPSADQASEDFVALVPPMVSYLGQGGTRFRAHVIDESGQPRAHGVCIAGDRGLLITYGDGGRTVAVRTNDRHDVDALRDMLRPYWMNKEPIIEETGRRTRETAAGRSPEPSVALPWERHYHRG